MSDSIAAVMSRISQIRSALGGGGGGVLGVANTGDGRFRDALSKASGESAGNGLASTVGSDPATADPLERAAIAAKVARSTRPLGAKPAGWPKGVPAEAEAYASEFEAASAATGVPIEVLLAVAWAESGFNPEAVSSAGAQGMMQLMPATGEGMGVTDPFDAGQNILGGAHYLKVQYERFGSWDLAFAAYNAGPGAVQQYGGVPPYPETRSYVDILNGYLEHMTPTPAGTAGPSGPDADQPAAPSRTERASMVSTARATSGSSVEGPEQAALNRQTGEGRAAPRTGPPGEGSRLSVNGLNATASMALAGLHRPRMDVLPLQQGLGASMPIGIDVERAGMNAPGMDVPGMNVPGMNVPGIDVPGMNVPGMNVPGMDVPGMDVPGMNVPGISGLGADGLTATPGPTLTAAPATTPTLTSTVAALPESLVALIQRSQHNGNGTQRLTVRLDPPELGRLDVLFEVRGDQVAVVVRPESAGAGQLMSHQRNRIADILAQQGLHLSGFDVATGGGERNPDRRPGPLSRAYPMSEADPIDLVQLTVDRALRL